MEYNFESGPFAEIMEVGRHNKLQLYAQGYGDTRHVRGLKWTPFELNQHPCIPRLCSSLHDFYSCFPTADLPDSLETKYLFEEFCKTFHSDEEDETFPDCYAHFVRFVNYGSLRIAPHNKQRCLRLLCELQRNKDKIAAVNNGITIQRAVWKREDKTCKEKNVVFHGIDESIWKPQTETDEGGVVIIRFLSFFELNLWCRVVRYLRRRALQLPARYRRLFPERLAPAGDPMAVLRAVGYDALLEADGDLDSCVEEGAHGCCRLPGPAGATPALAAEVATTEFVEDVCRACEEHAAGRRRMAYTRAFEGGW